MHDLTDNSDERALSRSGAKASAAYAGVLEPERPLTLKDFAQIIRRRLWVIVLVTLVFVGAAATFSLWQTPVYESSAKLLVRQEQQAADQQADPTRADGGQGLQQLTQTVLTAVDTRPVAEETIQRLGLHMDPANLLQNLTAEQIGSTSFIALTYSDTDPERAREIVNTVGRVSSERIYQVSTSGVTVTVWEDATAPGAPVSPDPVRNAVLALALGLMFGLGLAFMMEYLEDGWRSPDEAAQVSGVPTLGVIPKFEIMNVKEASGARMIGSQRGADSVSPQEDRQRNGFSEALVAVQEPAGVAAEAYRILGTRLFYPPVDSPPKVIVLTSTGRRDGRTTIAANLGTTLAQAGKNILLLDCDLRNPALHKMLGCDNTNGMLDILLGRQQGQDVWQEPIPELKMISAGSSPASPTELLSSRCFTGFLGEARQEFDYVLLDTPPIGLSDSFVLAANADGVLLILHSQRTSKASLRQALHDLQSIGASVLGTVMNSFGTPKDGYYSSLRHKA